NWRASHTTSRLDDIPDIIKNEDGTVVEAPKKASEVPATGAADLLLCYACQHVGRDVKVKEKLVLPGGDWFLGAKKDCFVGNGCCGDSSSCGTRNAGTTNVQQLRDQIQEFLIDDE
ncbi:hypothetical protein HDU99_008106, partial [Rhizoclosmatium hyalinum]